MQRAGIVLGGEISGMGKECVGSRTWRKVEIARVRTLSAPTRPESVSVGSECLESDILSLSAGAGARLLLLTQGRNDRQP